jgi:integrase
MAEYFVNYFSQNPLKEIDESSWEDYFCFIKQKDWSNSYKSRVLNSGKMFLNYLYEKKLVDLPRNLMSRVLKFKVSKQKINSTTPEIIQKLFLNANNQLKLHILLMANCGMISQDISDLQDSEVDWTNGTITRKRSKTKDHENVPEVCYKLWSETFELLKKYRSGTETVLLTKSGQPWIKRSITLKEYKNSNSIASNFKALCVKLNIKGVTTKQIRTTSSCTLAKHREFKFYTQYFLGQSPNGTTDSHYVEPSKEEFFEALDWLRTKFIL